MLHQVERAYFNPPNFAIGAKAVFRGLDQVGALGNRFRSWSSHVAMVLDGYQGWITIRNLVADSPFMVLEVAPDLVMPTLLDLVERGAHPRDLYLQEIPDPSNLRLINFEVMRSPDYLTMEWGTGQCPLRKDLDRKLNPTVHGLKAVQILRFYLGAEYEHLEALWELYPHIVVEASAWEKPVGVLDRHMVIWEGREY